MTRGDKLKEIRAYLGLTQKQLAEITGISAQQLGQYENGYRSPRNDTLDRIIHAIFNNSETADPHYFQNFGGNEDSPYYSPENLKKYILSAEESEKDYSAIIDPFSKLNERGQAKVISYAWDLTESEKYTD